MALRLPFWRGRERCCFGVLRGGGFGLEWWLIFDVFAVEILDEKGRDGSEEGKEKEKEKEKYD